MHQKHMCPLPRLLPLVALAAAGCFGSDPNKNSQIANPDASTPMSGSGSIDPAKPITGTALATFDSNGQAFGLDPYHDTNQTNLADPAVGAQPSIRHEPADGSPMNGALRIVAPYSGASQYVDLQSPNFGTNLQDWSGGKLHVRIKVVDGAFTGGAQIYVKTGTAYVFGGTYINFPAGSGWKEFTLDIENPMSLGTSGTYDPGQVISYGVQLNTGSGGTGAGPVTFIVDSFSIELPTGGGGGGTDGGTGGTGGGSGGSDGGTAGADGGGAAGSTGSDGSAD